MKQRAGVLRAIGATMAVAVLGFAATPARAVDIIEAQSETAAGRLAGRDLSTGPHRSLLSGQHQPVLHPGGRPPAERLHADLRQASGAVRRTDRKPEDGSRRSSARPQRQSPGDPAVRTGSGEIPDDLRVARQQPGRDQRHHRADVLAPGHGPLRSLSTTSSQRGNRLASASPSRSGSAKSSSTPASPGTRTTTSTSRSTCRAWLPSRSSKTGSPSSAPSVRWGEGGPSSPLPAPATTPKPNPSSGNTRPTSTPIPSRNQPPKTPTT